jgi:hypothetical protein
MLAADGSGRNVKILAPAPLVSPGSGPYLENLACGA